MDTELTVSKGSKFRNTDVILVITDVLGRVIDEIPTTLQKGNNSIEIPVGRLADATYFIGVRGANIDLDAKKFVKISN